MRWWKFLLISTAIFLFAGIVTAEEGGSGILSGGILQGREMAAALAISIPALSAGYAIAVSGSASAGAVAEKPEIFGKVLVFVAFAEAIAIYGLLVALMIVLRIGG